MAKRWVVAGAALVAGVLYAWSREGAPAAPGHGDTPARIERSQGLAGVFERSSSPGLRGRVLDPRGPVGGARVTPVREQSAGSEIGCLRPEELDAMLSSLETEVATTQSDLDGDFELPEPEPGRYALHASAPGVFGLRRGFRFSDQEAHVAVWPTRSIAGSVRDERASFVAEARVAVFSSVGRLQQAVTDANGRFQLAVASGPATVLAWSGALRSRLAPLSDAEPVELVLHSPLRIAGRVVGVPSGRAARVGLIGEDCRLEAEVSDETAFAFPGLLPGRYALSAESGELACFQEVELDPREVRDDVALVLE
jgi:hypothetical protein